MNLKTLLCRNSEVLHAPVGAGEAIMMSIISGRYYGVDAVGARIWDLLERLKTVGELCSQILVEFEVDEQTCHRDVMKFRDGLIANAVVNAIAPQIPAEA